MPREKKWLKLPDGVCFTLSYLLCHFGRRVRLIGGMCGAERWMAFQLTINAQNYRVRSEINVESSIKMLNILKATFNLAYRLALNTCGTIQQSARVISSPTQYFPAEVERSFSIALSTKIKELIICKGLRIKKYTNLNPLVIQCCAHSFFFSSPTWIRTMRFWSGWMPDEMTSHISLTLALLWKSWGNRARCGRVSSKYCMMDIDSISVCPSICSAGTCSIGFTSLYSLQCCSPPDLIRLIGLMS